VLLAFGRRELLPPLLRILPLRLEERPEGGAIHQDAVVEVHLVARVDLALGRARIGWRGPLLRALLDLVDEQGELIPPSDELRIAPFRGALTARIRRLLIRAQIGDGAVEAELRGMEMLGEERPQRVDREAVDRDERDEGAVPRREREVDRAVLVHALVDRSEELGPQPRPEILPRIDVAPVLVPCLTEEPRRFVSEAVVATQGVERAIEKADARGQGFREIIARRIEDALAACAEASERDAQGEAHVI